MQLDRRKVLLETASLAWAASALLILSPQARAGAQIEEHLADSVRTALTASISNAAPPVPEFENTTARLMYLKWLSSMSDRVYKRMHDLTTRLEFLQTVWYESHRAGLQTSLVLGLIKVESNFRKFAVSRAGALGFMQVMPFWTNQIGNGDPHTLFHMQTNLRFGCVILRFYLERERGNMSMALGRYNGSRGKMQYPNAVFGAQKQYIFTPAPNL